MSLLLIEKYFDFLLMTLLLDFFKYLLYLLIGIIIDGKIYELIEFFFLQAKGTERQPNHILKYMRASLIFWENIFLAIRRSIRFCIATFCCGSSIDNLIELI